MCHMRQPLESMRSCPSLLCIIDLPLLKPRSHELYPTKNILTSISVPRPRLCDHWIQVCSFCSEKLNSSETIWADSVCGQSSAYLIDTVGNELCKCDACSNCNAHMSFCLQSKKARSLCHNVWQERCHHDPRCPPCLFVSGYSRACDPPEQHFIIPDSTPCNFSLCTCGQKIIQSRIYLAKAHTYTQGFISSLIEQAG